ncbi:putative DNA replication complex GINS protein SLD5 [Tripterygium wilfordii]|uniref:DNA replication complex GINS protein SLD5 n=1 Tax=Tripterygium wilfordii TaxID=458696 RepID=A0A7J7CSX7_TRIWF|nr:DNA replication complex GINS protein SLD5 [Tripterygium wilfordii]KAF5737069.1 putative DNA replication complex GINS protein SLD5 [Tripterygium wilfordii]
MATDAGDGSASDMNDHKPFVPEISDLELLKTAWRNEKAAPEILPFQTRLVNDMKDQIQWREETVDEFEESGNDPLTVSLYQMDLDRIQFLLRSYLRVRLQKIEKYMFHILKTDNLRDRLSEQEKLFARRCVDDMGNHLEDTVLSKLPDNYQSVLKQSIISEEDDMVPEPQLDAFVAGKSRSESPLYVDIPGRGHLEMQNDDLFFLHYKVVKEKVENGIIYLV